MKNLGRQCSQASDNSDNAPSQTSSFSVNSKGGRCTNHQCPLGVGGKLPLPFYADVRLHLPMTRCNDAGLSSAGTNGHITWLASPTAPQSCTSSVCTTSISHTIYQYTVALAPAVHLQHIPVHTPPYFIFLESALFSSFLFLTL